MRDDLNAPRALAIATEAARASGLSATDRRALIEDFDGWLGLDLLSAEAPGRGRLAAAGKSGAGDADEVGSDAWVEARLAERSAARSARDFAAADRIRDTLAEAGIQIEDTPDGARWSRR